MRISRDKPGISDIALSDVEQRFKAAYGGQPERHLDRPHGIDEVADVCCLGFGRPSVLVGDVFADDQVFLDGDDVSIVRHPRYLPAISHQHSFFELGFVLAGSCVNFVGEEELVMSAGDLCIIPPGTTHAVGVFSDECLLINLLIRSSNFESTFGSIALSRNLLSDTFLRAAYGLPTVPFLTIDVADDGNVKRLIAMMYDESRGNAPYQSALLTALATGLLVYLIRGYPGRDQPGLPSAAPASSILQFIHENLAEASLGTLADRLSYSERHIQRIVATEFRTSFSELVRRVRMGRAAALLARTETSVVDIAQRLGYSEARSFRRGFRRHFGVTPNDYRSDARRSGDVGPSAAYN